MEVRLTIGGFGIGIPKTAFGANVVSGCYIETKPCRGRCAVSKYGVKDSFSLGTESHTVIASQAKTEWMTVTDEVAIAKLQREQLNGSHVDIEVSGTSFGASKGDVTVKVIDENGDATDIIQKYGVKMVAWQLDSTKIRGVVRFWAIHLPEMSQEAT